MITARIGRLPGTLASVALEDGATIADALSAAELDATGFEVRRNGQTASMTDRVAEDDNILLTRQIKGNQGITVKAGRLPGTLQTVAVEEGTTVAEVLRHANLDASGFEVRVNGTTASMDYEVEQDDNVLLTRQIKGN